jgi:hypothetical protein
MDRKRKMRGKEEEEKNRSRVKYIEVPAQEEEQKPLSRPFFLWDLPGKGKKETC